MTRDTDPIGRCAKAKHYSKNLLLSHAKPKHFEHTASTPNSSAHLEPLDFSTVRPNSSSSKDCIDRVPSLRLSLELQTSPPKQFYNHRPANADPSLPAPLHTYSNRPRSQLSNALSLSLSLSTVLADDLIEHLKPAIAGHLQKKPGSLKFRSAGRKTRLVVKPFGHGGGRIITQWPNAS